MTYRLMVVKGSKRLSVNLKKCTAEVEDNADIMVNIIVESDHGITQGKKC